MIRRVAAASGQRDASTFLSLLRTSSRLSELNQIHAQLIINGLTQNLITATKLTHKLFDFKAISQAKLLFTSLSKKIPPDLFYYNVLIRGFAHNNCTFDVLSHYSHFRRSTSLKPDNFTYAFVVSAVSSSGFEKVGIVLHGQVLVTGFGSDLFVGSALVDMYMGCSGIVFAYKVFEEISYPDTVVWNTMLSGLMKNSFFYECISLFRNLVVDGSGIDSTTLAVGLSATAELQELKIGMMVQNVALKLGYHEHDFVLTGLISLYSKCGDVSTAKYLFEQIENPDLISQNAMISCFSSNYDIPSAVILFKELLFCGRKVNVSTIVGLIPVSSPFTHLELSQSIHGFAVKFGMVSNSSVSTALVTVYSRLNETECARKLFDESPEKSLASWNAMISGYAQSGLTEMAISLFREMQALDVHPNPVTVTSILSACAQLGAPSLGKWVHNLIKEHNFGSNIYVSTALVDMYAKCGKIDDAIRVFHSMPVKNVVTWNAMISGYGLHGHGHDALLLFDKMLGSGVAPTAVTFLSLLYACSHAGMVDEGNKIFNAMIHIHGCKPSTEHYACMVDLLGRAGQLENAVEFIKQMPVEPGPAEWGALLGACMIHKDSNLAQVASTKLFELDEKSVGYYVLLSNIYSTDRNYPQAASIRQMVKRKNLSKTPGCTLIEVNGTPHVFTSSDQSHPQSAEIHVMLKNLMRKMKEAGFQAETTPALHDVEEEEKEIMVSVHSEKLAISFGLIACEPGAEIMIVKNLRVCLDCHSFTKFVSKISERLIVVRDANRFHHFKDGVCSCGDYW